ncbi:dihydrofolate reductase [Phocicoccus pinnipedialis]|uniref:Dihydrofolate reductase n=1 Tax=Phocicoccus pinnipedialis TaxID=110845 RepID=A0A6V7RCX9_9BACL|nr:dihydrofolate reductase [Jeotgalicoccus pinnipedialis]MBP1939402.1 dihydrofolate reductase [Jeotgalicoccus pinnipedialis]CAD2075513.1 Dihydrofolate reductase [Jeotgalicoccus pinnipedialis]
MISLIVAHANQNVIGFKGDMPWHLPADLKRVKALTTGNTIVMGRKTYESLGRPLPNRKNVVLTRNKDFKPKGVTVIHDLKEIQSLDGKVFIFGGSGLYDVTTNIVEEMYITRIYETFAGDTFFVDYDLNEWDIISREYFEPDAQNIYPYEYLHLVKK